MRLQPLESRISTPIIANLCNGISILPVMKSLSAEAPEPGDEGIRLISLDTCNNCEGGVPSLPSSTSLAIVKGPATKSSFGMIGRVATPLCEVDVFSLASRLLPAPPLPNPPAFKLTSIKMSSCQFVSFKLASVQFASPNAFFVNFSPSPLPNFSRSHLLSPAFIKELITNILTGPAHLYQAYLYSTSLYRTYLFQIAIYLLSRGRLFFIGFTVIRFSYQPLHEVFDSTNSIRIQPAQWEDVFFERREASGVSPPKDCACCASMTSLGHSSATRKQRRFFSHPPLCLNSFLNFSPVANLPKSFQLFFLGLPNFSQPFSNHLASFQFVKLFPQPASTLLSFSPLSGSILDQSFQFA